MKIKLTGAALADAYAELLGLENGGKVWAKHTGRMIEIHSGSLPVHPQLKNTYRNGWVMADTVEPAYCREYLANRGCMGQWHAYSTAEPAEIQTVPY